MKTSDSSVQPFQVCHFKIVININCYNYCRLYKLLYVVCCENAIKIIHWLEPPSWNWAIPTWALWATLMLPHIFTTIRNSWLTLLPILYIYIYLFIYLLIYLFFYFFYFSNWSLSYFCNWSLNSLNWSYSCLHRGAESGDLYHWYHFSHRLTDKYCYYLHLLFHVLFYLLFMSVQTVMSECIYECTFMFFFYFQCSSVMSYCRSAYNSFGAGSCNPWLGDCWEWYLYTECLT